MKALISGIVLLALAGCATVPAKKLWSLDEDGGMICRFEDGTTCSATSYQEGTNPRRADCLSPNGSTGCKAIGVLDAAGKQWFDNLAPALDAIGKIK